MDHGMTRRPLPVTFALAEALALEGDLFVAARKLCALADPDLRPVTALLLDILTPLCALGVFQESGGRRVIDRDAVMALGLGLLRLDEATVERGTSLAALAAACRLRRGMLGIAERAPPDAAFLHGMMAAHPDLEGEKRHEPDATTG
jgi:hypothetical protein